MTECQQSRESSSRLRATIERLLGGQDVDLSVREDSEGSVLLLETPSDVVGFSVLGERAREAFPAAYRGFKRLYREQHAEWHDRNLSFVLCISPGRSGEDAFLYSIESDVYFCRKYLVSLQETEEGLERELLSLPFMPMPAGREGGVVRPPSAQTLLQSIGLNAALARKLIVPRECSASTLAEEFTGPATVLPQLRPVPESEGPSSVDATERTRIKRVIIEGFRAYKTRREFDLDADVVVLFGRNGLGKTSFFDALDFVCTGRIGRLCRHRVSQQAFVDLARHLDAHKDSGCVTMEIDQGSSPVLVERRVDDWGHAAVGGETQDRASALQFLTSADWGPKKPRIENLERLFRATHLFSQTDPELLLGFQEESVLSAELVSRTLALDDYASGLRRLSDVVALLEKRTAQQRQEFDELAAEVEGVESRLADLPEPGESAEVGEQLKALAADLLPSLGQVAGVKVDDTQVTPESAREWRALAEAELEAARARRGRLERLGAGFAEYERNLGALSAKTEALSRLEHSAEGHAAEVRRFEEAKKRVLEGIEQSRNTRERARAKIRSITELRKLLDSERAVNGKLQEGQSELEQIEAAAAAAAAELERATLAVGETTTRISQLEGTLEEKTERAKRLTSIRDGLAELGRTRGEEERVRKAIADGETALHGLEEAIERRATDSETAADELAGCRDEYEKYAEEQADLTRLLDEIEAHVKNGVCPACGIDHGTAETLIERIHSRKEGRPAEVEQLSKRCRELRTSIDGSKAAIAELTREAEDKRAQLAAFTTTLVQIQTQRADRERRIEAEGLSVDDPQLATTVAELLAGATETLEGDRRTLEELQAAASAAAARVSELEGRLADVTQARKRARNAVQGMRDEIESLNARADSLGFSLSMPPAEIESEEGRWATREAESERQASELSSEEEALTTAVQNARALQADAAADAERMRSERDELSGEIDRYRETAEGVVDRGALELERIVDQKDREQARVDALEKLTRRALHLETAVDSASRSAVATELALTAKDLGERKERAGKELKRLSVARRWVAQVNDVLERENSGAVASHVRAFGPLTTLIQKRLRAVYGFGDVSLVPKGSEVRVLVAWGNQEVRPTDYFSDSQKQILMLSLFLAGRLTQTWSGFAPILMDDPVTHFDDLNAFGFVELIRGMVGTSPGKRQFFISTCEERLFELMRKKFSLVQGGAKFYRFDGIDADGPLISPVS